MSREYKLELRNLLVQALVTDMTDAQKQEMLESIQSEPDMARSVERGFTAMVSTVMFADRERILTEVEVQELAAEIYDLMMAELINFGGVASDTRTLN
jgi:hypothetical protein